MTALNVVEMRLTDSTDRPFSVSASCMGQARRLRIYTQPVVQIRLWTRSMSKYELNCWPYLKLTQIRYILKTTTLRKRDSFMVAALGDNVLSSDEPESTLGERICNARQAEGFTLNLASHLAGVKASTLRDWEEIEVNRVSTSLWL